MVNLSLYGLLATALSEVLGNFWHGTIYIRKIFLKLFSPTALMSEPNTLILLCPWLMSLPHGWSECEPLKLIFFANLDFLGTRIGYSPWIRPQHLYKPSSLKFRFNCCLLISNCSHLLYRCCSSLISLIRDPLWFYISLDVNGSRACCFLQLVRKRFIQLKILKVFNIGYFTNNSSKMVSDKTATAKISCNSFAFYFRLLTTFNHWLIRLGIRIS